MRGVGGENIARVYAVRDRDIDGIGVTQGDERSRDTDRVLVYVELAIAKRNLTSIHYTPTIFDI